MEPELRGEFIASLATPDQYHKNVGQVVTVSSEQLRYVRRKELQLRPFEIEVRDISICTAVTYKSDWSLSRVIFGGVALLLAAVIVVGLFVYGDDVQARAGQAAVAIIALVLVGYRYFVGGRRHSITFHLDDEKLRWKSRPGEYKTWTKAVEKILTFFRSKGLYGDAFDIAPP